MAITNRFVSGFELNSLTANDEWETVSNTSTPLTLTAGAARTGNYGLRCLASSSTGYVQQRMRGAVSGTQTMFARFYIKLATDPSATAVVAALHNNEATQHCLYVAITTAGVLQLRRYHVSDAQVGSNGPDIGDGEWHYVEFGGVWDTDRAYLRVDGTEYVNAIASNVITVAYGRFGIGTQTNGSTWGNLTSGEWYIDDIIVCDGTDSTDTIPSGDWPGAGGLIILRPDSAGESDPTTGTWDSVDETPPSTADVITCTSTTVGYFNLAATPAEIGSDDTIHWVAVGGNVSTASASSANWQPRIQSQNGGTKVSGTSTAIASTTYQPHDDTAGSRFYKLVQATDPQGGGPWTKALLDTAQIGFARVSGTPDVRASALWAYVSGVFTGSAASTTPAFRLSLLGVGR